MSVHSIPDSPDGYVTGTGTIGVYPGTFIRTGTQCAPDLADVVARIFERWGLTSAQYDVSALEGIEVLGYRRLPNGAGGDASLAPLMQAHCFDIGEWDGKLHCVPRGGPSVLDLTVDDLAERDGPPVEWTKVQEVELLRLQTVAYFDPAAGYEVVTQKHERRAGTIRAKGEAAVEVPLTADADFATTVAKKRVLIAWSEKDKGKLSLPGLRFATAVPTTIATFTDENGKAHRLRFDKIEDDSGVRLVDFTKERGSVYGVTASGVSPTPDAPPGGSGLVGPTILHPMNLPSLRSSDAQPGIYVPVTGLVSGWKGADIYVSVDGGVSYQFGIRCQSRAIMGKLAVSCTASSEPITVSLYDNRSVSSVTTAQIAARQNAFAITTSGVSEIGQAQTSTENIDGNFELTDTTRGQLTTIAVGHNAGDQFTMLDGAVPLLPLSQELAGQTILLKAVSIGASLDATEAVSIVFDPPEYLRDGGVVTP